MDFRQNNILIIKQLIKQDKYKIQQVAMETLSVKLQSLDDKVMFDARSRDNRPITIDYFPPVGNSQGYSSLELLMAGFGSCIGTTLLVILRHKMQKNVGGLFAEVNGRVRDKHPKALESIHVSLHIKSTDVSEQEVQHALKIAEDGFCPVWAMLRGNVEIGFTVNVEE